MNLPDSSAIVFDPNRRQNRVWVCPRPRTRVSTLVCSPCMRGAPPNIAIGVIGWCLLIAPETISQSPFTTDICLGAKHEQFYHGFEHCITYPAKTKTSVGLCISSWNYSKAKSTRFQISGNTVIRTHGAVTISDTLCIVVLTLCSLKLNKTPSDVTCRPLCLHE